MSKKDQIQDIDYLYASARLRCLEKGLLDADKMERMTEAKTMDEVAKIMAESNYPEFFPSNLAEVEEVLSKERNALFALITSMAPDTRLADVFKVKFDYHNAKTIIKGELTSSPYNNILSSCGRIDTAKLAEALRENNYAGMPSILRASIEEARETLSRTGDPQLADCVLDRGCFAEMLKIAKETGSKFLEGYVRLQIDSANLRTAVRVKKMGKSVDFLRQTLIEGGNISVSRLTTELTPDVLESLYHGSELAKAAAGGIAVLNNEAPLSKVDLLTDNAQIEYLKNAKYVAFGEQPLVAYIAAKENELTAIRTIMSGRFAELPPEMIRERLREAYV